MTIFEDTGMRMQTALQWARISATTEELLAQPVSHLEVAVPVLLDDGSQRVFTGWRTRWNDSRGPGKGGLRFHPQLDSTGVGQLAFGMTLKNALMDLPFGGGKGGVRVDTRELSQGELQRLCRSYIHAVADVIGPDRDIPAPDMYTNPTMMGWMLQAWRDVTRRIEPAVITGKPLALGGSHGRDTATADGAFKVLQALLPKIEGLPEHPTVAVQGFGNAGARLAELLADHGFTVVAISDSRSARYDADGLDIAAACKVKDETGQLPEIGDEFDADELLTLDVDVLAPAACGDVITGGNADDIRASVVVEAANHPVTPEADEILSDRGVMVIPDILANAGGVTVSWMEWVQNRRGERWSAEKVRSMLDERMESETEQVWGVAHDDDIPLSAAAYVLALRRLDEAITA